MLACFNKRVSKTDSLRYSKFSRAQILRIPIYREAHEARSRCVSLRDEAMALVVPNDPAS